MAGEPIAARVENACVFPSAMAIFATMMMVAVAFADVETEKPVLRASVFWGVVETAEMSMTVHGS